MKAADAVSRALSTNALTEVVSHVLLIGSHPGSDIIAMRLLFPMAKILAISRIPASNLPIANFLKIQALCCWRVPGQTSSPARMAQQS